MATIATPFADMEAGLAAGLMATMANAVLVVVGGAGAGTQLPAVFSQPLVDGVGGMRLPGREPTALVPLETLPADVQQGSAVQVVYRGTTTLWSVQRRTDSPEAGDALLDLELPA